MAAVDQIKATIARDMVQLGTEIPVTVTFEGKTYSGYRALLSQQRLYSEWGYGDEYDFSVILQQSDLDDNSADPSEGKKVTIDGKTYRILDSRKDNWLVSRRLDLVGEFGG